MAVRSCALLGAISGALAQEWFNLQQRPSPLGDFTADERAALKKVDPGIAANPSALGVNLDMGQLLREHGDEDIRTVTAFTPAQWGSSPAVGAKLLNSTPYESFGATVVDTDQGPYPATLYRFRVAWKLPDRPRRFALMVLEMIEDYRPYLGQLVPYVSPVLQEFRKQGLPVFFSTWGRRPGDGLYGGFDRGWGFRGLKSKLLPTYVYKANGAEPMKELMPTDEELRMGHLIKSIHDNKFDDLDADGRSIFADKLKALGVDTLVLAGGWSDACVLNTAAAAVDARNLDVVVVRDAVGTADENQQAALSIMKAGAVKVLDSSAFVGYLEAHAGDPSHVAPPLEAPAAIVLKAETAAGAPAAISRLSPAAALGALATVAAASGALGAFAACAAARRRGVAADPYGYEAQPYTAQV